MNLFDEEWAPRHPALRRQRRISKCDDLSPVAAAVVAEILKRLRASG
jgi:hypothetical protein